ncbi:MAG TPA: OmpA family protein [Verrucomicrobiae bacterium]
MKSAKLLNLLVASLLLVTFATGCKKGPKNITAIPRRDLELRNEGPGTNIGGNPLNNPNANRFDLENGPGNGPAEPKEGVPDAEALAAQTIYFDFDRSAIRASEQPKIDAVATYVKNNPNVKQIIVEGHCDERGTEEYNRSLGERRANAAREYLLQKHGLSSDKVTTVSFGEDRPASLERTEEGYAKNRRGQFVVVR